jgi:outer membrane protein assembly factor BamE (lipoprotein component of BamABCDE complex)
MRHVIALVVTLGLTASLAGCASYSGQGLVPGQSSADEVEALMGPSAAQRPGTGGETVRYYPRQPEGRQTYAARIGPDGKLRAIEQRLTEANVARLSPGLSRSDDVRDLFGPPYMVNNFSRMQREVWTYNIYGKISQPMNLFVQFSGDGVVREVMMLDDPRFASMDTP